MKKCIHCGAEIPNQASFCPVCSKSVVEKDSAEVPDFRKKHLIRKILLVVVLLAAACLAIVLYRKPQVIDAKEASLVYTHGKIKWNLVLRNATNDDFHWTSPQYNYSRTIMESTQAAIALQLYVFEEGTENNVAEDFLNALDHSELVSNPQGSGVSLECSTPAANPGFPKAALCSDIVYNAQSGSNILDWRFYMKNGDTLILHEKVDILLRPTANYDLAGSNIQTSAELGQYIADAFAAEEEGIYINFKLEPITYEGNLTIQNGLYLLEGADASEGRTFINGKVLLEGTTEAATCPTLRNLNFEGENTGIETRLPVFTEACSFDGSKIGISSLETGWGMPGDCVFNNCEVGIYVDTQECVAKNMLFYGSKFTGNKTAILLKQTPWENDDLYVYECTFEDNETDIDNQTTLTIKYDF